MSAGVTTTHDKYPPFTRAELQAIRDRAEWIGAQLIDPHAACAHLDLAQAADHMDAILARAESKPDLKLYDPSADTELYVPPAPNGFVGFDAAHVDGTEGRAMPAAEVLPKPPLGAYPRKLWDEQHPNPSGADWAARRAHVRAAVARFRSSSWAPPADLIDELQELDALLIAPEPVLASAGPGPSGAASEVPGEKAARMREVLAALPVGGWLVTPEAPDDSPRVFQLLAERTRGRLVDRIARRHSAKHAAVEAALTEATRDRPLWQWLRDGGLERLIALVVSLLPLFV